MKHPYVEGTVVADVDTAVGPRDGNTPRMLHGFTVMIVGHLFRVSHSFLEGSNPMVSFLDKQHRVIASHDEIAPSILVTNLRHGVRDLCVFRARPTGVEFLSIDTL